MLDGAVWGLLLVDNISLRIALAFVLPRLRPTFQFSFQAAVRSPTAAVQQVREAQNRAPVVCRRRPPESNRLQPSGPHMQLPSYFSDFLHEIRPTGRQIEDFKKGHTLLRQRLLEDEKLAPCIVTTFLQGSYRRRTAIRPQGEKRPDVDVVVVTRLSEDEYTPERALQLFEPFVQKHYAGKYKLQGRSIGIRLSYVDLDLVITSAPSEAVIGALKKDEQSESTLGLLEEDILSDAWDLTLGEGLKVIGSAEPQWKNEPLRIPDREAKVWQRTHPLEQMEWTRQRNARTSGYYVNVVKALKWWRRINFDTPKHPKSYPLERIIDECCPDGIPSIADGVVETLEAIARMYETHARLKLVPTLPNHGVPEQNVLHRITGDDFAAFHGQVVAAADVARRALDAESVDESVKLWKQLFGDKFPKAPPQGGNGQKGGYTPRQEISKVGSGRFA